MLRICEDTVKGDEAGKESFLEMGKRSVSNGLRLVERILDHTKIESGSISIEKTDCDFEELLNYQSASFRNLCSSKTLFLNRTLMNRRTGVFVIQIELAKFC